MADYTVRRIDEMEAAYAGAFKRARAELGVSSFGMQVLDIPANVDRYPEHDHAGDGQEEVYVVLRGSATLQAEGEQIRLDPDVMVRVGAGTTRKIVTGAEPVRLLALGGVPSAVYEPPEVSELGALDPFLAQQG